MSILDTRRINRYIAHATGMSRRAADAVVAAGRVTVNQQLATPGTVVAAGAEVRLDGQLLLPHDAFRYLMLHKPTNYISSRAQQGSTPTLYSLLPAEHQGLQVGGRLDKDSSGLMLLSDDGDFIQRMTHPSYGKDKQYELTLSHPLSNTHLQQLEKGIRLADGLSHVRVLDHQGTRLRVALTQGRNRQLRRTFDALGYAIHRLHRTSIGPYSLGDLPPGAFQVFQPEDES